MTPDSNRTPAPNEFGPPSVERGDADRVIGNDERSAGSPDEESPDELARSHWTEGDSTWSQNVEAAQGAVEAARSVEASDS